MDSVRTHSRRKLRECGSCSLHVNLTKINGGGNLCDSCSTEITGPEVLSETPFLFSLVNGFKVVTVKLGKGLISTYMCKKWRFVFFFF